MIQSNLLSGVRWHQEDTVLGARAYGANSWPWNGLRTSDKSVYLWILFPPSVKWKHWIKQTINFLLVLAFTVSEMERRKAEERSKTAGIGHMIDTSCLHSWQSAAPETWNPASGIILIWDESTHFLARTRSYSISNITVSLKAKFQLVIMHESQGTIRIGSQVNHRVNHCI